MPTKDELYEGLPDDAGLFERKDGFILKMRNYKGKRIPMWVKSIEGNEKKRKASDEDMEAFENWKAQLSEEEEEEEKAGFEEVPMVAFADDGRAVEIWGTLKAAKVEEIKNEDGDLSHVIMQVRVEDVAGDVHEFDVPKGGVAAILSAHDPGKWSRSAKPFHKDMTMAERKQEMKDLIGKKRVLLWRLLKKEERDDDATKPMMLTVRTKQWCKVTIDDLMPAIKEGVKGQKAKFHKIPSDGVHGGRVVVTFPDQKLFRPVLNVNAGRLGGMSLKVFGGATILACTNELTADVRHEVLSILEEHAPIAMRTRARKVHRGESPKVIETIQQVTQSINEFGEIIEKAKAVKLSQTASKQILQYYEAKKVISKKVREYCEELVGNEEIEQEKGTFYGLAMVLSWAGTHNDDFKSGVKYRLGKLAGEVILCSEASGSYRNLVKETLEQGDEE